MRIGRRIALGYIIVIAVTAVVGIVSVWSSRSARREVVNMDAVYLPEMKNGSAVERTAWALFFHTREYSDTFDPEQLAEARGEFASVSALVSEGRRLSAEHERAEYSKLAGETEEKIAHYGELIDGTEKAISEMVGQRGPLNAAASAFVSHCDDFVTNQTETLNREVAVSQSSIKIAQEISDHGTQARILSFEAQSSNNYGLFGESQEQLKQVLSKADILASRSTTDSERTAIDAIKAAASSYAEAINDYYEQVSDEEDVDVMAMMESRQQMEVSAGSFSGSIKQFLEDQNTSLNESVSHRLETVTAASAVLAQGNAINVSNFRAQAERRKEELRKTVAQFEGVFSAVSSMRSSTTDADELRRLALIESAARDYKAAMTSYLAAWDQLDANKAERAVALETVLANANGMASAGLKSAEDASKRNASHLSTAATISVVGVIVSIVVAVVLAIFSVRSITAALRILVRKLNSTSGSVYSASRQVSSASHELAQGSSEQAASVEETSSSLEELASMTRQNAEHASTANHTVKSTAEVVEEATAAMNELTASMSEIANGSKETQKIIKTIDEIAFQTNLLALNAAVEAARAGEAGAGFAVVADEVRNLAIRAAEAARNTAGLIENSVKKIDVGSNLLSRTNDAFSRVATQTNEVRDLISNIATASGEQSNGIEQINKAVSEMDRVVQNNASSAEETASAANELNQQARNLERVVVDLNALLDGEGDGRGASSSAHEDEMGAEEPEDFDFEMPPAPAPKTGHTARKVGSGAASNGASTAGVIRDSEMSHDDFEFDDSDFTFDVDDDFESPKR